MEGEKFGWKFFSAKVLTVLIAVVFAVCLLVQVASAADPAAPTGVYVSTTSTNSMAITWVWGSGTEAYFTVDKSTDGATFTNVSSSIATTTLSYEFTGLSLNTQYTFRVASVSSTHTATSSFATTSAAYTLAAEAGAPTFGTPTDSTIPITLNGNGNPSVSTTYSIYNSTDNSYLAADGIWGTINPALFQASSTWGTSFAATALAPNTDFIFVVQAKNGDGVTSATSSDSARVYTLASTPSASATADSPSQITLIYSGGNATSFDLTGNGTSYPTETSGTKVFTGLSCGTAYTFTVIGNNGDGAHSTTATASATTQGCGGGYIAPALPASAANSSASVSSQIVSGNTVTLNLNAPDATAVAISENADFSGSSWIDYSNQKSFALSDGNGEKTLYIKFRYSNGTQTVAYKTTVAV